MEVQKLISLLSKKKLTIASVESLTAGLFIATLASAPGASKVVRGGLITYQSTLKESLLGIKKETIKRYGVVSKEIAIEMVKKGQKILKSDLVVSFTGNAGPTAEKGQAEVGRVHMALLFNSNKIFTFTKVYKGRRNSIRKSVVDDMVKKILATLKS